VDYLRAGLQLTVEQAAASEADDLDEARASWTAACSICMELPARKRKRFGCLNGCNHAFCLRCIREWRESRTQSRKAVLVCPVCRVLSTFVIPSLRHVTHPDRKARLIEAYRRNLKAIDCVHFARGDGVCPFGKACHYRHQQRAGEDAQAQRLCMGADGTLRVSTPKVTLLDFVATRAKTTPG
jgi:E3 ubiquitin-protein ligase makorin